MGMERVVSFDGGSVPAWPEIVSASARLGLTLQMRMIDGQLAFPDEEPPDDWRELRVATAHGMMTLRREGSRILVVVWGNADAALQQEWQTLTNALAEVGNGIITGS